MYEHIHTRVYTYMYIYTFPKYICMHILTNIRIYTCIHMLVCEVARGMYAHRLLLVCAGTWV